MTMALRIWGEQSNLGCNIHCFAVKKQNALNVGISAHVPSSLRCPSTTNFPGSQTLGRWSCCSPCRFSKVQMLGNESTPSSLRSKDWTDRTKGLPAFSALAVSAGRHTLERGAGAKTWAWLGRSGPWDITDASVTSICWDCTGRTARNGELILGTLCAIDSWPTLALVFSASIFVLASPVSGKLFCISTSFKQSWDSANWFIHSHSWSTCLMASASSGLMSCTFSAAYSDNHWRLRFKSSSFRVEDHPTASVHPECPVHPSSSSSFCRGRGTTFGNCTTAEALQQKQSSSAASSVRASDSVSDSARALSGAMGQ